MKTLLLSSFFIVLGYQTTFAGNDIPDTSKKPVKVSRPVDLSKELVGYWFIPHSAGINIKFNPDKSFLFNDCNLKLDKEEQLRGTYELIGNSLVLHYNDRSQQKFSFHKGKGTDTNYYIEKKGYYFVKGEEPEQ
jgi:hypothetical protein